MSKNICKNCNQQVLENFCSFCGQSTSVDTITFKETFNDFLESVFSVNAPLVLTFRLLILNPGKLFREYLSGKRKTYYKPVSFFILSTFLYLVLRSVINYNPVSLEGVNVDGELLVEASKYMVKNINNILFLLVVALGIFLKLFFLKRHSLAEFLAISFYLVGIYTLMGAIFMFYLRFVNPTPKYVTFILFFFYIVYAFISFFQVKKIKVALKVCLVFLFSFMVYIVFGFFLSLLIVWLKHK